MASAKGPIFIGGCPRSGMTLLGAMLDSHPAISCGPDAGLIGLTLAARDFALTLGSLHREHFHLPPGRVSENFATAIRRILEARARRDAKERAAEKSALNVLIFSELSRLFPDAQFIHCVRDGRDVAASLLERQWRDPKTGSVFAHCADAHAAARYWAGLATIGLEAETRLSERVLRVPYENLAADPEATLQGVLDFLGIPWDDGALSLHTRNNFTDFDGETAAKFRRPIHAGQVGRWRSDLSGLQQAQAAAVAGPLLKELGYA